MVAASCFFRVRARDVSFQGMPTCRRPAPSGRNSLVRAALALGFGAWLMMLMSGCKTAHESNTASVTTSVSDDDPHFIGVTDFSGFERGDTETGGQGMTLVSPVFTAPRPWEELVVSWNAVAPLGCGLKIEARTIRADRATAFYTMGLWADDTADQPRTSVNGQKDEDGDVLTDTLVLNQPAQKVQVRLTWRGVNAADGRLKFLGLSFARRAAADPTGISDRRGWGRVNSVPELSQLSYEGGEVWCSPTSVSMVLGYWAQVLKRPELKIDVPEVAAGVFDPGWPGTGNWPFNTAFAGKFPDMRAYVMRCRGISDLESWVASGVPPILSVSSDVLNGRVRDRVSGHLVVCVGFTDTGEVILNDPGVSLARGQKVRRTVSRERLLKAWAGSRQTAYLIHPEEYPVPAWP